MEMSNNNIDTNKVETILQANFDNAEYFNSIADNVASQCTSVLDNLMQRIYNDTVVNKNPADDVLENYFLELSNTLYFLGDQIEHMGVNSDLSDLSFKETFNRAYLDSAGQKDERGKSVRTVDENKALAAESSKYEEIIAGIQQRAYELVKYKINAGQTMVGTLSKLISKRMSDASLSMTANKAGE